MNNRLAEVNEAPQDGERSIPMADLAIEDKKKCKPRNAIFFWTS